MEKLQELFLVELQKKLKIIFKLEINFTLIIIQNQKIKLVISKLKSIKHYPHFILMNKKNCHVLFQQCI